MSDDNLLYKIDEFEFAGIIYERFALRRPLGAVTCRVKQSEPDCLPASHVSSTYPVVTGHLRPGEACSDKLSLCIGLQTDGKIIPQNLLGEKFDDPLSEIGRQVSIWFRDNGWNKS